MYVVRDIFRCKPGKAKELAERFKRAMPLMERDDRFRNNRVMVDAVAGYWTVVLQSDVESLSDFERHLVEFGSREDVRAIMSGYMELVDGGHREIFRVV